MDQENARDLASNRPSENKRSYSSETPPTAATETQPPWLNEDGSSKSLEEIRKIAETWRPADWESYLASTETYQREEYLKNGFAVEKLKSEDYTAALVEILQVEEYPALRNEVGKILNTLSPRHRRIVQLRYWENKTRQEIADIIGISRQGVDKALKVSHKRIEARLRVLAAKKSCLQVIEGASKSPT